MNLSNHAKKAPNQADNFSIFQSCLLPKMRLSVVLKGRYTGYMSLILHSGPSQAGWGAHFLTDQLTLSQPGGGAHYPHAILCALPDFQTLRRPCNVTKFSITY